MNNLKQYGAIGLCTLCLLAMSGCYHDCCDSLNGTTGETIIYNPGYTTTTIVHHDPSDITVINYPSLDHYYYSTTVIPPGTTISTTTYSY